jgi:hypothetical protein
VSSLIYFFPETGYKKSIGDLVILLYRGGIGKEELVVELGEGKNMQVPPYASLHKATQPKLICLIYGIIYLKFPFNTHHEKSAHYSENEILNLSHPTPLFYATWLVAYYSPLDYVESRNLIIIL